MSRIADISAAFIAARRNVQALNAFPGTVPSTLADAYAVQARSVADWGEPVVGYKVGGIAPDWREQYPRDWLAGPVFPSHIITAEDTALTDVSVFRGGFAAYEPELVFGLDGLSSLRGPIKTLADAKQFVTSIHIGAEIASSPLATLNALGPGSIISDFGNQSAVVIGPKIDIVWIDRLDEIEVTTIIDAQTIGVSRVKDNESGPLGALRFLLNHIQAYPPLDRRDTAWLSSGAITGVHQAHIDTMCSITYHGLGKLRLRMVPKIEKTI